MTDSPASRRRVLIVEDEPALRTAYQRHFGERYELVLVGSGTEALRALGNGAPHVAVLDMRLPDMNGIDLLRRMREQAPDLPVIITTAYMSLEPQLGMLDLPHSGYIVKPFRVEDLASRIDAIP